MATARVKWNKEYREKWRITFDYANLDAKTAARLAVVGKKVYRLLYIQDYGRIDLRLTPDNKIYIIEANCNPDLNRFEEVAESAGKAGISYPELIQKIIHQAIHRHAMSH
jgi:D-alanine-D-alanine ligase